MKVFITELQGKNIMTADGKYLGQVDNVVVDTNSGDLQHLLVIPTEEIDISDYKTDRTGRVVLPFSKIKSMKDVIILKPL
jgi:sporulation protein YlmC with PRC-barrel domain